MIEPLPIPPLRWRSMPGREGARTAQGQQRRAANLRLKLHTAAQDAR